MKVRDREKKKNCSTTFSSLRPFFSPLTLFPLFFFFPFKFPSSYIRFEKLGKTHCSCECKIVSRSLLCVEGGGGKEGGKGWGDEGGREEGEKRRERRRGKRC